MRSLDRELRARTKKEVGMALSNRSLRAMGIVATMVCLAHAPARAATLVVASDGVDAPLCGSKAAPCRSIGRAIANAGAGDRIVVGPGHYGDLDGDGILGETGEEQTGSCSLPAGVVVVCVDKPVTLLSRDGSPFTVIDVGDAAHDYLVAVRSPGAALGAPKKGFTVIGGSTVGVAAVLLFDSGATAAGNRLTARITGLDVEGTGHVAKGNQLVGSGGSGLFAFGTAHQIDGNQALGSDLGFNLAGCQGCRVVGNFSARNARHGFLVFPDSTGLVVEGNVATANGGAGFATAPLNDVLAGVVFRGNAAVRNLGPGFLVDGTDLSLTGNAAIGNAVAGVEIAADSDAPLLSKNNFIGNGTPEGNGCGVLSAASSPVDATASYWGAATGPGPRPADDACGGTAGVVATPFATKPIKVKPKLPRID